MVRVMATLLQVMVLTYSYIPGVHSNSIDEILFSRDILNEPGFKVQDYFSFSDFTCSIHLKFNVTHAHRVLHVKKFWSLRLYSILTVNLIALQMLLYYF